MNNSTDGAGDTQEPFGLQIVLRFSYALVFLVGLFGNLLVCIVIIQQRRMRTDINYLTLNLAISDLILIVFYLPTQLAAYESQSWPFGNVGCRIVYSIVPVTLTTSITTLLAISCERFRGIVFPFQPRLSIAAVRRIIMVIWLLSLASAIPLMIVAGTKTNEDNNKVFCEEPNWSSKTAASAYWITMFLVQYVIPLFLMIVLYGIAGWKIQQRSRSMIPSKRLCVNSLAQTTRQQQSQKITKMLVALILLYTFCMLPQHVIYFWIEYGSFWGREYSMYVFRISNLFPMANSALNSIAYGTLQADFRKAYKTFFASCKRGNMQTLNETDRRTTLITMGNGLCRPNEERGEEGRRFQTKAEAFGHQDKSCSVFTAKDQTQSQTLFIDLTMDDMILLKHARETIL